jgi:hypothetical protein
MRPVAAFIANYAEIQAGMVQVIGGFPEWWSLAAVPGEAVISAVLVVEVEPAEVGQTATIDFFITAPDGTESAIGAIGLELAMRDNFVAGAPRYEKTTLRIMAHFESVGSYRITFRHEGVDVGAIAFGVRLG